MHRVLAVALCVAVGGCAPPPVYVAPPPPPLVYEPLPVTAPATPAPLIVPPSVAPVIPKGHVPVRAGTYGMGCDFPYDRASNGSMCGGRSAWSRPGGRSPVCYADDQ
jgi:hypothetical protein